MRHVCTGPYYFAQCIRATVTEATQDNTIIVENSLQTTRSEWQNRLQRLPLNCWCSQEWRQTLQRRYLRAPQPAAAAAAAGESALLFLLLSTSPPFSLARVCSRGTSRRRAGEQRQSSRAFLPAKPPAKRSSAAAVAPCSRPFGPQSTSMRRREGERQKAKGGEKKKTFGESTEEKIKLHLGGKFYQGIVIVSWQLLSIWVISRRDWFNKRNPFPSEMIFSNSLIEPDPRRVKTRR